MTADARTDLLALDVGGTKLAAAVAGRRAQAETPGSGREALAALLALAESLVDERVRGIGVSFGGHVVNGAIRRSLHVEGWEDVALADALRDRFDAPVRIANDADAGALGEWDAAGRPKAPVCYVTVSTGVGGGIVVDGEILSGVDGLAGEIGHLVVAMDGDLCACGRRGCIETVASGPAIARRAGHASAEEVADAARRGDAAARDVLSEAARALAVGIAAVVTLVNPAFVAIGGGVSTAGAPLWDTLRTELRRLAWPDVTTEVRLAASVESPLRGALILAERAAGAVD